MKRIPHILIIITQLAMAVEFFLMPITLLINENHPDLINETEFLLNDFAAMVITFTISITIYRLFKSLNQEK